LELLKQGFRKEGIAKTRFSQKSFIGDSRVDFWCFLEALGAGFLSFSAWKQARKLSVFQGHLGDPDWHQEIKQPAGPW
jgi:hypothetical protein